MVRTLRTAPQARHPLSHALSVDEVIAGLDSSPRGLTSADAQARVVRYGPNVLPQERPVRLVTVFARQFASPFIYVLLFAATLSVYAGHWADAGVIAFVLVLNAVVGTAQEYRAQRSALALRRLVSTRARVVRDDDVVEMPAEGLVPGDVVLMASGDKVPADVRLLQSAGLLVDESTLTGESLRVSKQADVLLDPATGLADQVNRAFAGTLVTHGRAEAIVVATGSATVLGGLARAMASKHVNEAPLVTRMRQLTVWVSLAVAIAAVVIGAVEISRGESLNAVLLLAVALAVSAIPEGLPVALTVALAIGMARMARRNVIVRRLVAVESLGSCTVVASDKTGTLTVNELTVRHLAVPGEPAWEVTGAGSVPEGEVCLPAGDARAGELVRRLAVIAAACNEASLSRRDDTWVPRGDAVDIACLVLAHKAGVTQPEVLAEHPLVAMVPFEPEQRFAASLHEGVSGGHWVAVKGGVERVIAMCDRMATRWGEVTIDEASVHAAAGLLAADGERVIAFAAGRSRGRAGELAEENLTGLTFVGLAGMIDPLRPDARASVAACGRAGVVVDMVTGDHPVTAAAIARDLDLAHGDRSLVTGSRLRVAQQQEGSDPFDALVRDARVFARVEPEQKLEIVQSLARSGHVVAVTGDGANDAPALRQAHVGVAMGRGGTDVAREAADIVITDDAFTSIVAGIEEGRVAYANVRKVVQLLLGTGAGEVLLVLLAVATNMSLPVVAVQLLWLNLVTNGIQDVALAFEPAEGDEMRKPPRPPAEPIFNRIMIERVALVAIVMSVLAFGLYRRLLDDGQDLDAARNAVVLLLVLFENVLALSARSETASLGASRLRGNPILVVGVGVALLVHLAAMHLPWSARILHLGVVPASEWLSCVALAGVLFLAVEGHKWVCRRLAYGRESRVHAR